MKRFFLISILSLMGFSALAQNVNMAGGIDLSSDGQIIDMRVEVRSAAPSDADTGDCYYDSDDNYIYYYNGTAWVRLFNLTSASVGAFPSHLSATQISGSAAVISGTATVGTSTTSPIFYSTGTTTGGGLVQGTSTLYAPSAGTWRMSPLGIGLTPSGAFSVTGTPVTGTSAVNGVHAGYASNYSELHLTGVTGSLIDFNVEAQNWLAAFDGRIIYTYASDNMDFYTAGTKAMTIEGDGDVWFLDDISAVTITDRTDSPKDATAALEILKTSKSIAKVDGTYGIDYSQLDEKLIKRSTRIKEHKMLVDMKTGLSTPIEMLSAEKQSEIAQTIPAGSEIQIVTEEIEEVGRNLTMTVSALSLAFQELERRNNELEARIAVLEKDKIPANEKKNQAQDAEIANLKERVGP